MTGYDQIGDVVRLFHLLLNDQSLNIPQDVKKYCKDISFINGATEEDLILPCKLKQAELISALKAIEALVAIAISNQVLKREDEHATIDLQHSLMFLFSTYLSSVNGFTKLDPRNKSFLKDTDLNQAQSITYRRMSANLYKTKDDRYYHIHGSLEASKQLEIIGLDPYRPDLTDYDAVVATIQSAVSNFTADELEEQTLHYKQAGVEALKYKDFKKTQHGQAISKEPVWRIDELETNTPAVPFDEVSSATDSKKAQILKGIKVIELCRVIAGPTIGRLLAEYGAEVLKITSPNLPDVPFFQVDSNFGKHTTELDLKSPTDRETFENLVLEADVIVDGYRTNAFTKLGYGPDYFKELAKKRGKGFIYGSENCFGFSGEWSPRAGWQQISDCVTGVAWIQGESFSLNEPMVPPFPMSDYGTGEIVAISILLALYKRSLYGGSYWCKSSLVQYDLLLIEQAGLYPDDIWERIIKKNNEDVLKLRYYDSVDKISSTVLKSMKKYRPELFDGDANVEGSYFVSEYSSGFKAEVKVLKPVIQMKNTRNGFNVTTRPNGHDKPEWSS